MREATEEADPEGARRHLYRVFPDLINATSSSAAILAAFMTEFLTKPQFDNLRDDGAPLSPDMIHRSVPLGYESYCLFMEAWAA